MALIKKVPLMAGFFLPFTARNKKPPGKNPDGLYVRKRRFELPRPLQALPPQSSASTSFATAARAANLIIVRILKNDLQNNVLNPEL